MNSHRSRAALNMAKTDFNLEDQIKPHLPPKVFRICVACGCYLLLPIEYMELLCFALTMLL